jgi:hypothetical protein
MRHIITSTHEDDLFLAGETRYPLDTAGREVPCETVLCRDFARRSAAVSYASTRLLQIPPIADPRTERYLRNLVRPVPNPMLTAAYVALWERGTGPDRLSPVDRWGVDRLLSRRNTCPDDDVDDIDAELVGILDRYLVTAEAPRT